jgi:hypothetical protein
MRANLGKIEKALQKLIEGGAHRILGSAEAEKELVTQLVAVLEKHIRPGPDGSPVGPHIFTLSVPPSFAPDVRANQAFLDDLAASLHFQAVQTGIKLEGHLTITVFPDSNLDPGEFTVQAIWRTQKLAQTGEMKIKEEISPALKPPKAFLIVEGAKIYTIDDDVVNIGRLLENHLVLDDPRVSRSHAQLRAVKGRHILFDLGSSGGTFVNGERISQISLHPGDVIILAGVPLVYGQDAVSNLDETMEYRRPRTTSDESTTTVRIKDLNLDLFDE